LPLHLTVMSLAFAQELHHFNHSIISADIFHISILLSSYDPTVKLHTYHSFNQSFNQLTNQSTNQSISIKHQRHQYVHHSHHYTRHSFKGEGLRTMDRGDQD